MVLEIDSENLYHPLDLEHLTLSANIRNNLLRILTKHL